MKYRITYCPHDDTHSLVYGDQVIVATTTPNICWRAMKFLIEADRPVESVSDCSGPEPRVKRWMEIRDKREVRFVDNTDGTVTDTKTNLMWWKEDTGTKLAWKDAAYHCAGNVFRGYPNWRLPTIEELTSLVDYERSDPAIDPVFRYAMPKWYWSSTVPESHLDGDRVIWIVSFGKGFTDIGSKTNEHYARAVRTIKEGE